MLVIIDIDVCAFNVYFIDTMNHNHTLIADAYRFVDESIFDHGGVMIIIVISFLPFNHVHDLRSILIAFDKLTQNNSHLGSRRGY